MPSKEERLLTETNALRLLREAFTNLPVILDLLPGLSEKLQNSHRLGNYIRDFLEILPPKYSSLEKVLAARRNDQTLQSWANRYFGRSHHNSTGFQIEFVIYEHLKTEPEKIRPMLEQFGADQFPELGDYFYSTLSEIKEDEPIDSDTLRVLSAFTGNETLATLLYSCVSNLKWEKGKVWKRVFDYQRTTNYLRSLASQTPDYDPAEENLLGNWSLERLGLFSSTIDRCQSLGIRTVSDIWKVQSIQALEAKGLEKCWIMDIAQSFRHHGLGVPWLGRILES